MSYQDRINSVKVIVEQHNEAIGVGNPGFVKFEEFFTKLKVSGATSEERLSSLSYEDILICLPLYDGIKPVVLAKEIAKVFRNKKEEIRPISNKKADKMTKRELVEAFDPEDYSNSVGQRLLVISKNQPFIVYSNGRLVDVESTFKLLSEVQSGYSGRESYDVDGTIKKVYKIGELPENYADENPLYRGRPLRPDGTCDQINRSWEGVDLNVRQFIRVTIDTGELKLTHELAHDVMDMAVELDAFKKLRQRYRKSAIKYDELLATGNLPTLKITLQNNGGSKSTNPFADSKKVEWTQKYIVPLTTNVYGHYSKNDNGWWYSKQ